MHPPRMHDATRFRLENQRDRDHISVRLWHTVGEDRPMSQQRAAPALRAQQTQRITLAYSPETPRKGSSGRGAY